MADTIFAPRLGKEVQILWFPVVEQVFRERKDHEIKQNHYNGCGCRRFGGWVCFRTAGA
jgi:hypothetical protein